MTTLPEKAPRIPAGPTPTIYEHSLMSAPQLDEARMAQTAPEAAPVTSSAAADPSQRSPPVDNQLSPPPAALTLSTSATSPATVEAPRIVNLHDIAVPLSTLGAYSAMADCPKCGKVAMTTTESQSGGTTHAWAAVACVCACLPCIPYLIGGLKDQLHKCSNCLTPLALYHRSGHTDVLINTAVAQQFQQAMPEK